MKDMLFLHSYDLIKEKQQKNSLKQNLCYIVLLNEIMRKQPMRNNLKYSGHSPGVKLNRNDIERGK